MNILNIRIDNLIAAFFIALLGVTVSLSYHFQLISVGFLYFDSISYIGKFIRYSQSLGVEGYWATISRILAEPHSMAMAVAVLTHKIQSITTTAHLPQATFFMAIYCFLIIWVAETRQSRALGVLLSLAIIPTFLLFGLVRSISDFWLESVAIWIYGILLISLVEARWFMRRAFAVFAGFSLAILLLYRMTYPVMTLGGFALYGLISIGVMVYEARKNSNPFNIYKKYAITCGVFVIPVLVATGFILFHQLDAINAKVARGYARVDDLNIVIRYVKSRVTNQFFSREVLWIASVLSLAAVLILSILRKSRKIDIYPIVIVLVLSIGFWFTSIFILGARYHSYSTALVIQFHLLLVYAILAISNADISLKRKRDFAIGMILLVYLLVATVIVKNNADIHTKKFLVNSAQMRGLIGHISSIVSPYKNVQGVGLWYHEHYNHLSLFNKIFRRQPTTYKKVGMFSVHGTYYTAAKPGWDTDRWVKHNLQVAGSKRSIVFAFCSATDLNKTRIRFTHPETSKKIAELLPRALNNSDEWIMFNKFKYRDTKANLCAFRNFDLTENL